MDEADEKTQPAAGRAGAPKRMTPISTIALVVILGGLFFLVGCTSVGKPMRTDPKTSAKKDAWYIEGKDTTGRIFSCSFIEFDGRGDYIDFNQHKAAWQKVKDLAEKQKLLLVFYCHGWKNNSQSGDVVEFNEFLSRLSASPSVTGSNVNYRVHGIYLSWRGNLYHPYVDPKTVTGPESITENAFGEPIVDRDQQRWFSWTHHVRETLSYWGRRKAAEYKVSSVPIARSIYTCASLAKSIDKAQGREGLMNSSRVMVMGHSFGALLLERALNSTCLDPLTDQWAWFETEEMKAKAKASSPGGEQLSKEPSNSSGAEAKENETSAALMKHKMEANPLPIDFVLFVNSAAPAIYCKTMRDFLTAHHRALRRANSPYADTPIFMSLTSSADWATGVIHPIGNLLAPIAPSLQHTYENRTEKEVALLKIPAGSKQKVHQSAFYNRTPGHQPLLVDHWIVEDKNGSPDAPSNHQSIIDENLNYTTDDPFSFYATDANNSHEIKRWRLSIEPPDNDAAEKKWANEFGPLEPNRSSYWIMRCNKEIIRGHNDVWSDSAMETYAALYRLVEWTRLPQNQSEVRKTFDAYWKGHTQTHALE